MSRNATVPGRYRCGFLTPPVWGPDLRPDCVSWLIFLGAFPPVLFLAVCFVRAIKKYLTPKKTSRGGERESRRTKNQYVARGTWYTKDQILTLINLRHRSIFYQPMLYKYVTMFLTTPKGNSIFLHNSTKERERMAFQKWDGRRMPTCTSLSKRWKTGQNFVRYTVMHFLNKNPSMVTAHFFAVTHLLAFR